MTSVNSTKYPSEIIEGVKRNIMKKSTTDFTDTELVYQIELMSKVEVMDCYLDTYQNETGRNLSGPEIRRMINEIFGINLDGIASLEGARISLFSKDQWVIKDEKDLFVIHTGKGDVDVVVFPTEYFKAQTGLINLPSDLQHSLRCLGYYYDDKMQNYYFANPTGEAVTDSFKGQTIKAIIDVIRHSYANI